MGSVLKFAFNKNALSLREANNIVNKFLSYKKPKSSITYKSIWKIFNDWVSNPEIQITQITPLFIEEFFNVLSQRTGQRKSESSVYYRIPDITEDQELFLKSAGGGV